MTRRPIDHTDLNDPADAPKVPGGDRDRRPPTLSHNYLAMIAELGQALPAEARVVAHVEHDTWCDALNGRGFCNCEPVIVVLVSRPGGVLEQLVNRPSPPSGDPNAN